MDVTESTRAFGAGVCAARKARGWTQCELAAAAGTSQRFVSELERGKATAEIGKAFAVAAALGLGVELVKAKPCPQAPGTRRLADYL